MVLIAKSMEVNAVNESSYRAWSVDIEGKIVRLHCEPPTGDTDGSVVN